MKPFEKPIYVTRPMLANLDDVNKEFYEIWQSQWLTNGGAKHQKSPYLYRFDAEKYEAYLRDNE